MLDHTWFWFWTRMVAVSICWLIQLDSTAQFPNIYCMSKTCYQLINLYCQGEMSLLLSGFLWPCWHWLITCMCSTYLYWSEGLSHFLQTALSWLISAGSICGHWLVFGKNDQSYLCTSVVCKSHWRAEGRISSFTGDRVFTICSFWTTSGSC